MIATAIGLPTGAERTPIYDAIQDRLQVDGFGVYMPQGRYDDSGNISTEYNAATKGLNYSAATLAMLRTLPYAPMLVHYGPYYFRDKGKWPDGRTKYNPDSLSWPNPGNPAKRLTQDELTDAQLTGYLQESADWLFEKTGKRPIMFFDEPPHKADKPDPATYGWSVTCEARICKMARCARAAGWLVAVAMPSPSQMLFWMGKGWSPTADGKPRIEPDIWVLNDAEVASKWPAYVIAEARAGGSPQVWLYNVASFVGLAYRMRQAGGTGFLHYRLEPSKQGIRLPDLATVTSVKLPDGTLRESYVLTADYTALKAELLSLDAPVEPEPVSWQEGYAWLNARLKKAGL